MLSLHGADCKGKRWLRWLHSLRRPKGDHFIAYRVNIWKCEPLQRHGHRRRLWRHEQSQQLSNVCRHRYLRNRSHFWHERQVNSWFGASGGRWRSRLHTRHPNMVSLLTSQPANMLQQNLKENNHQFFIFFHNPVFNLIALYIYVFDVFVFISLVWQ